LITSNLIEVALQTAKNNAGFNTAATPVDLSLNSKAQQFTVSAPSGAMLFMANIGNRVTNNTSVTALNGTKSTFTGLGAHYNFSKNSYAYLMYERATMNDVDLTAVVVNGAAATNTAGAYDRGRSVTAIGFSQAF
jgi:hypothetical protein